MDWQQLAERCEQAEGPSKELDGTIWWLAGCGKRDWGNIADDPVIACGVVWGRNPKVEPTWASVGYRGPTYTASIDAALTLVPEGWGWSLYSDASIEIYRSPPPGEMPSTAIGLDAATPALALCAAALKAMNQGGE